MEENNTVDVKTMQIIIQLQSEIIFAYKEINNLTKNLEFVKQKLIEIEKGVKNKMEEKKDIIN